ncbi:MAG: phosphate ABC transporter permease PstA [Phascolarctobacterium sp.]|nr:phosphate ABC transporter permease PstA [Phascolarctobacterium sp.]
MVNCLKMQAATTASNLLGITVWVAAGVNILSLIFLIGYILAQGISYLNWELFAFEYTTQNVSLFPALVNTVLIIVIALSLAAPLGICTAIYFVEYAKKGNKLVSVMDITTDTLAGIPSVVYGLFGLLFFVSYLQFGYSLLAGACTVAIMILPVIIRTTEEALQAVPVSYKEGSYALGANKLRTVFVVVLPAAVPGILTGIILSIGRIIGETAALIYTAGTVAQLPENMFSSGRSLAVHLYVLASEGLFMEQAFATAVVLVIITVIINLASTWMAGKLMRGN